MKIMCQGLPLGCLHLLDGLYGAGTLAVVRDFKFFTGTSNGSETFCTVFLYKVFIFPNFGRIFQVS